MSSSGSQASAMAIIDPLAHAAGQLVRVLAEALLGAGDADLGEQVDGRSRASPLVTPRWARSVSAICWPTVNTGSSAVIGSWKIMRSRSRAATHLALATAASRSRPRTGPGPRPGPAACSRRMTASAGDRLAAAALAHHPDGLAGPHREADVPDGLHLTGSGCEPDRQVLHAQDLVGGGRDGAGRGPAQHGGVTARIDGVLHRAPRDVGGRASAARAGRQETCEGAGVAADVRGADHSGTSREVPTPPGVPAAGGEPLPATRRE